MVTDPAFRLPVIGQESRVSGILTGVTDSVHRLEVAYVAQTAVINVGETLVTAGVDGSFPKGIPVGIVTQVTQGNEILFQQIHARPVVNLDALEEVLLLQEAGTAPPLLERLHNPVKQEAPLPPAEEAAASQRTAPSSPHPVAL
jgi:rod shape-determining protein MreC